LGKNTSVLANVPALSFARKRATKLPDEQQNWARTVSYTGTHTPGEREALALEQSKVKLLSLNQEPNTVYGIAING
jgi:hypothetical protein